SSRRRHTRFSRDWSSDLCSSDLDKLAGGVGLGPRFLISEASLRATDLLQPGSLVRWIYRVKLPDGANDDRAATALIDGARAAARSEERRVGIDWRCRVIREQRRI